MSLKETGSFSESNTKSRFAEEFDVSRETLERFEHYREALILWGKRINLVSKTTIDDFWNRHIIDCAQILKYTNEEEINWVDFGSGAGFPGLVVAALLSSKNPNSLVTLVDTSAKRCAFLREGARILGANVKIENKKVEDIKTFKADVITARAFTSLDNLLHYSYGFAQLNARMLFLKGEEVDKEIKEAKQNWNFDYEIHPSLSDNRGCIIEIKSLTKVIE